MREAASKQVGVIAQSHKGDAWLAVLYLFVTLLVNLGALVAVPKFSTPEIARQTLPFYALPIVWAGYLLFAYRKSWLRRIGYIASLPALIWLWAVIVDIRLIIRS